MQVAITGASGLIGKALAARLREEGARVRPLVRRRDQATGDAIYWNVRDGEIDAAALEGVDAVV
ncbi:MAG: NAD-dependent epimerase/dehydratase family protein, partial [Myxococcota bacterium]